MSWFLPANAECVVGCNLERKHFATYFISTSGVFDIFRDLRLDFSADLDKIQILTCIRKIALFQSFKRFTSHALHYTTTGLVHFKTAQSVTMLPTTTFHF